MNATSKPIRRIVVVGGGSAGWLTAGRLAAQFGRKGLRVTLVESPDVNIAGVGEGTWPTMRTTLRKIGLGETSFMADCDAAFKQGSMFARWVNGDANDSYFHPFTLPEDYVRINPVARWQALNTNATFGESVCFQEQIARRGLAPKQAATPDYAHVANYGYHFDAARLAECLQRHCTEQLNVEHKRAHIRSIATDGEGNIQHINGDNGSIIEGDFFIDCSGQQALLIGQHFKTPLISQRHILFADRALAIHAPHQNTQHPIAPYTLSTAQNAGWVWDIGLASRRGLGYVYSSSHQSNDAAASTFRQYLTERTSLSGDAMNFRAIEFEPGYREHSWQRNCVAIGLSAGFLEPLEASSLALVEHSINLLCDDFPTDIQVLPTLARRFNKRMTYHWRRVVEFLKLHYVLSQRTDSEFWLDNRCADSIPDDLAENLELWRHQSPWLSDFDRVDEIFSAASYQYVLYGMGFDTARSRLAPLPNTSETAPFNDTKRKIQQLLKGLPSHRDLLNTIHQRRQSQA